MATFRAGFPLPIDVRDEFDRLWTALTAAPPLHGWGVRPAGAFPAVNLRETAETLTLEAELPGLEAADVEVSVNGEELVLSGSRPGAVEAAEPADGAVQQPAGSRPITWHRRERGSGRFERRIPLPVAVDADRVEARLVDGVLTVTCPKAAAVVPRRIPVQSP
jgi:HSP20 family protein